MVHFKKIDRVSVSEEITEYLKDQILRRQLKPGTQLPSEERMAESMGVGRGTTAPTSPILRTPTSIRRAWFSRSTGNETS